MKQIKLLKVLSCHRNNLAVAWMVAFDGVHNIVGYRVRVQFAPLLKLHPGSAGTREQGVLHIDQGARNIVKKSIHVLRFALVVVVRA